MTAALRAATGLITKGWSHWAPAMNAEGIVCHPLAPDACKFDPLSALDRACQPDTDLINQALEFLDSCAPGGSVTLWNDNPDRKHEEVIKVFQRATQRASRVQD